jgi:hypothetical protein
MATRDFVVFDSDSNVVEPPALWEKYLGLEYRTLGKHASGGARVAPGPISGSTARCSATTATSTCRAAHSGGRAWIAMQSVPSTPRQASDHRGRAGKAVEECGDRVFYSFPECLLRAQ